MMGRESPFTVRGTFTCPDCLHPWERHAIGDAGAYCDEESCLCERAYPAGRITSSVRGEAERDAEWAADIEAAYGD